MRLPHLKAPPAAESAGSLGSRPGGRKGGCRQLGKEGNATPTAPPSPPSPATPGSSCGSGRSFRSPA